MELDSKGVGCSIFKDGGGEAQARGGFTRDSARERKAQAMVRTNRRDLRRFEADVTVRQQLTLSLWRQVTLILLTQVHSEH